MTTSSCSCATAPAVAGATTAGSTTTQATAPPPPGGALTPTQLVSKAQDAVAGATRLINQLSPQQSPMQVSTTPDDLKPGKVDPTVPRPKTTPATSPRTVAKPHKVSTSAAMTAIGAAPTAAQDAADKKAVVQVAKTRTAAGNAKAQKLAADGQKKIWYDYLASYKKSHTAAQGAAAQKLMDAAYASVKTIDGQAKAKFGRKRPFVANPKLTTVVPRPKDGSFPSGHSAGAAAGATIMSYLWPDRKAEFPSMAQQVAQSRVYGGVHYPTDTQAGLRLGTNIANQVLGTA